MFNTIISVNLYFGCSSLESIISITNSRNSITGRATIVIGVSSPNGHIKKLNIK